MDGFAPSDKNGNYKRPKGFNFDNNFKINLDKNESFHLLIGSTCPWCHRTLLFIELQQLSKIKIIYLKPNFNNGEWIFESNFFGNKSLKELYKRTYKKEFFRATVPLLVKTKGETVEFISNESGNILEIFNALICDKKENIIQFDSCDNIFLKNINDDINNGVYKCGFARNQKSYVDASTKLFKRLSEIDSIIKRSKGPWLCGENLTYADIYLFPTLIRWELIYSKLFKCTEKEISEYKNIMEWRKNFFNLKGVKQTCFENNWLQDYYQGLFPLNPSQIVPIQPKLEEIIIRNKG